MKNPRMTWNVLSHGLSRGGWPTVQNSPFPFRWQAIRGKNTARGGLLAYFQRKRVNSRLYQVRCYKHLGYTSFLPCPAGSAVNAVRNMPKVETLGGGRLIHRLRCRDLFYPKIYGIKG